MLCHLAQSMYKVPTIQIVEPILIWVMGVGMAVEIMSRWVLHPILITSILWEVRTHVMMRMETYLVFLFIVHEGGDGPTLVGAGSSLATDLNGGMAYPQMVDGARNNVRKSSTAIRRHV